MKERKKTAKKHLVVGLTGSFGSGKTFVAALLRKSGAGLIDADKIAHQVMVAPGAAYKRIVAVFGRGILLSSGSIDRKKLGKIVFGDGTLLVQLTSILHPEIIKVIKSKIATLKQEIIVVDAPLLFESGLDKIVDKVLVVTITRQRQLERLRRKTRLSKPEVLARINEQMPLSLKVRKADFIIDNNGTKTETKKAVEKLRRKLWTS